MKRTSKDKARVRGGGQRPKSGTRRLPWGWVLLGGAGAFVLGVILLSLVSPRLLGLDTGSKTYKTQRPLAPDLTLATEKGEYRLSEDQGKVVLLYFSFPGWPTCALEAPALAKLQSDFAGRDFRVVAINIQPSYSLQDWKEFWRSKGAGDVLWAQDTSFSAISKYQLVALGTEVLINRRGEMIFRSDGPASHNKLRAVIESALPN